jgi:hypothetical protein
VVDHPVSTWAAVRAWAVGRFGFIAVAVGLAVVLASVIVFGPISGRGGAASGTPSQSAAASEMAASGTPAPSTATPSASPSAGATADTGPREATVVASLTDCRSDSNHYVHAIVGNELYVACGTNDDYPYIARVDLTTNKIVARYTTHLYSISTVVVDGGSLWYGGAAGSGCIAPCTGMYHTVRVDLATARTALDHVDWMLRGDGLGYVWVSEIPDSGQLIKLDPATGAERGRIPNQYGGLQFACGSMWGLAVNETGTPDATTTITRVDPATGAALAAFTEPGYVGELQQVGNECWATVVASPSTNQSTTHFDRIGQSGIEFRSPMIPDQGTGAIFQGTFWAVHPGTTTTVQRIDPASVQPVGGKWTYKGAAPILAAGGTLWAQTDPNSYPSWLVRLSVTLE